MGTERDWSGLPMDLLLIAMTAMEVPDIVHSGSVCSSWRSAYVTFRRLRLVPTLKQPPCLLYARGTDAAAALYSPSAKATFRVPSLPTLHGVAGSAHGWLFTTDEAANPYLLNPLTGDRAALPPVTTLERVKSSFLDVEGNVVYNVDMAWNNGHDMQRVTAQRAREWMYRRVAVSAGGGAGAACTVLLLHMPHGELSFARPGDERWTLLRELTRKWDFANALHNDRDGLFYVLRTNGELYALDLKGPSPVVHRVSQTGTTCGDRHTHYLVLTPSGDLLVVTRRLLRGWTPPPPGGQGSNEEEEEKEMVATICIWIHRIDVDRQGRVEPLREGVGDNALFLGRNSPMCLPIKDYPMLNPNCAYLVDDSQPMKLPIARRDLCVLDLGTGRRNPQKLSNVWPLPPWLDTRAPIWITPSLY